MNVQKTLRKIEKEIAARAPVERVAIFTWDDRPTAGLRVSGVAFITGNSGPSFTATDLPIGLAVCASVERYAIALIEEWPDEEIAEERSRMFEALCERPSLAADRT